MSKSSVVADTHTAIWYLTSSSQISAIAASTIKNSIQNGFPILLPTICIVEVTYLSEKNKVPTSAYDLLIATVNNPRSGFKLVALDDAIAKAVKGVPRDLVPDMPDRIIAATAMSLNLPLVTRDEKLRNFSQLATVW